ncbi:SIMPL domain-containing protein [Desertibacillus haloalkaliphilus]|uniref:SIMPL domain-containing protein n=1 Tax=Desertibacillus haloalkaliphilus TaxID=1328930 RepID=UPI001C27D422|nr:SIMPL domain-containing protein [Desertibacillus haloalkaliphilus]MBU8907694.1 SIMPL domain-containing protein [Desertibacillus haloalkaliphilus]
MIKKTIQVSGVVAAVVSFVIMIQLVITPGAEHKGMSTALANAEEGTLVVTGVGEISVEPDIAFLHLGAQAVSSSADEAQTEVSKRISAVRQVLNDYGVEDDAIETARFHVYPESRPDQDEERYRAEHILEIEYKELERIGELLDDVTAAGANRIEQTRFGLQNPEEAEHEALKLAIEKAKARADIMAETAGRSRGEVLQIADQAARVTLPVQAELRQEMAQDAAMSTVIEPGEVQVRQQVDVIYRLQ